MPQAMLMLQEAGVQISGGSSYQEHVELSTLRVELL